jgi:LPXTG-motif cell wall-anchored protein
MPSELAIDITAAADSADQPPIIALKSATLKAVKPTGEEVEMSEVVVSPPTEIAAAHPHKHIKRLPQTATQLPLLALIGLLSLGAGFALLVISKRTA